MAIARCLADLVGDDALVDAAVGMAHKAYHQTVDVPDCTTNGEGLKLINISQMSCKVK